MDTFTCPEGPCLMPIDILNKDCRRSISAILTWVLENVKISVRPLNSIGNQRVFTLLLKLYLLPLAHTLLRVKCRYMSLVCINVTQFFFSRVVFFPAVFSAGQQTCLVAWTTSTPLDRFDVRLKKLLAKKLHDRKQFWLHFCKLEICTYISLAAIYGLTAITKILVAGWKHASFLCYSMGARWFLRFLGPKLELLSMSAYSPYLRRLC